MCYRILRTELRQRTQARIDREVEELLEEDQEGQDSGGKISLMATRVGHSKGAIGTLTLCEDVLLWQLETASEPELLQLAKVGVVQSALRECLESELAAHSRDVLFDTLACV